MEKFSRRKRYNIISLVTFTVIAITFGYYYFYYVQFRESQFNAKAFRTIENIGANVEKKYNNYYTSVGNAIKHIYTYKDDDTIKIIDNAMLQRFFEDYHVPAELKVVYFGKPGSLIDSLQNEFVSKIKGDETLGNLY